jgi:exosortase
VGFSLSPEKHWRPLLIVGAIGFSYWSVLAGLAHFWWTDENYSHGLLIPLLVLYILWSERDSLAGARKAPATVWGLAAIVCALLALWAGIAGAELFIQRMSLVILLAGVAVYFWGFGLLKLVLVPLLLLALAIPIPSIVFNRIAFPLQLFASRCAVWAMRQLEIPVLREGNVIELLPRGSQTTTRLEVVEACSGIRSLMTLVTLAVVFAYFTRPRTAGTTTSQPFFARFGFWRAVLIVGSAVPIAIVTNALRVSGTGVLSHYYGTEVADGFFHSFSGWVVYVVAFILLVGMGWLIDRLNPNRRGRKIVADSTVAAVANGAPSSK